MSPKRHDLALILNSKATDSQLKALVEDLSASNNRFYCRIKNAKDKVRSLFKLDRTMRE